LRDKRVGIGRAVPDTHSPATSSSHRMGGRYRIQSVYWSSGRQSRTRHFAATRSMRSYSKRGIPMA
jgi:hypothetical protein